MKKKSLEAVPERAGGHYQAINRHYPGFSPETVFDVGANVGGSARGFADLFPEAAVFAFEPVASTYDQLVANTSDKPNIRPFNLALGRRSGSTHVTKRPASPSNRVMHSPHFFQRAKVQAVPLVSGDDFAAEHSVERIGFLKIDAEGHDLDVLVGFQGMLASHRIDLLETEVGMNRENRRHVPFEAVKSYLEPFGYSLFHLHDLAMDTPFSGRIVLRRVNAMFVSEAMVEAYRQETDGKAARSS